ncbi:hypothetical protein [uncultured Megamonas sp.]|uniref:hypothetical protein n=1 Tax=uncultured Megamonas sp. TaxID=286140 RepID=UPI0025921A75|nr:hypothetical protein [uncultured Megamonas sp.]
MKRNVLVLELNIADFLAEYFNGSTNERDQFSYCMFWDKINEHRDSDKINIFTGHKPKTDSNFYYEYGLLKAEEEMEAEKPVTELKLEDGVYGYNICYENPDEEPVSFYFYTRTRITAFIQHENEVMNLAAEMQEITQQKPILCLESHKSLFCEALDNILAAYSNDYYDETELQAEYQNNSEIADWMRYEFRCSRDYEAYGNAVGNNIGNAIDAAWTWFRTGYVNDFISIDTETGKIYLNW